jgi:hypothetical protein
MKDQTEVKEDSNLDNSNTKIVSRQQYNDPKTHLKLKLEELIINHSTLCKDLITLVVEYVIDNKEYLKKYLGYVLVLKNHNVPGLDGYFNSFQFSFNSRKFEFTQTAPPPSLILYQTWEEARSKAESDHIILALAIAYTLGIEFNREIKHTTFKAIGKEDIYQVCDRSRNTLFSKEKKDQMIFQTNILKSIIRIIEDEKFDLNGSRYTIEYTREKTVFSKRVPKTVAEIYEYAVKAHNNFTPAEFSGFCDKACKVLSGKTTTPTSFWQFVPGARQGSTIEFYNRLAGIIISASKLTESNERPSIVP